MCVLSRFSRVRLFANPWTVAFQVPLTIEFSRQEYWSGSPCPSPGDLPMDLLPQAPHGKSNLFVGVSQKCTFKLNIFCLLFFKESLFFFKFYFLGCAMRHAGTSPIRGKQCEHGVLTKPPGKSLCLLLNLSFILNIYQLYYKDPEQKQGFWFLTYTSKLQLPLPQ